MPQITSVGDTRPRFLLVSKQPPVTPSYLDWSPVVLNCVVAQTVKLICGFHISQNWFLEYFASYCVVLLDVAEVDPFLGNRLQI